MGVSKKPLDWWLNPGMRLHSKVCGGYVLEELE